MPDSPPTVVARWSSPYNVDAWARLLTLRTNVEIVGAEPDEALVLGPALPSGNEPRIAEVFALRDDGETSIQWTLRVSLPPDEPPPPNVQEADTRLGGGCRSQFTHGSTPIVHAALATAS